MAVATVIHGGYRPSELRRLPTSMSVFNHRSRRLRSPPPIIISTNLNDANLHSLRDLFSLCDHSCLRFPKIESDGRKQPIDLRKLGIALSHSSIVVSVFTKPEVISYYSDSSNSPNSSFGDLMGVGGDWFGRMTPITPSNGELVGFGRAVSDYGLTASIYDVMVIPSLRGMGIGRTIVQRIIRALTSRGIYDIAALCSAKERSFFEACGFGDDILGSTTMMYSRAGSSYEGNQTVKSIGEELLLAPPARETFDS